MPDEGTPDGSAFGFYERFNETVENDPLLDDSAPEEVAAGSEEPEAPEEPSGAEVAAPPGDTEAPPVPEGEEPEGDTGEAPGTEEAPLYAGKYQSAEALESAYREAERMAHQRAQETAAMRTQFEEMQQVLAALVAERNQQRAELDPEFAEELERIQQLQPLIEQQVAPLRQQLEVKEREAEFLSVIAQFRANHPDVPPNSEADQQVAGVVAELELDIGDPNALELAYEVSKDPFLRTVLAANPTWVESQAGLDYAEVQAQALRQAAGVAPAAAPPAGTPAPPPTPGIPAQAYVESGGAGAPSLKSGESLDEFDEVLALADQEKATPFF